jgi:hypothetical protein
MNLCVLKYEDNGHLDLDSDMGCTRNGEFVGTRRLVCGYFVRAGAPGRLSGDRNSPEDGALGIVAVGGVWDVELGLG